KHTHTHTHKAVKLRTLNVKLKTVKCSYSTFTQIQWRAVHFTPRPSCDPPAIKPPSNKLTMTLGLYAAVIQRNQPICTVTVTFIEWNKVI
ncbi:hypothetical protein LDENG_00279720, partial [Lucifuga dentata]